MAKFRDLQIGDKFVHGYKGTNRAEVYEKKSKSSAYTIDASTLEPTHNQFAAYEDSRGAFHGFTSACIVHRLAV
jgi:hypothetical protein